MNKSDAAVVVGDPEQKIIIGSALNDGITLIDGIRVIPELYSVFAIEKFDIGKIRSNPRKLCCFIDPGDSTGEMGAHLVFR